MKILIFVGKFFLKGDVRGPGYLEITDGVFGNYTKDEPQGDVKIIREEGKWTASGLVDTHTHSYMNRDVIDSGAEGIRVVPEGLLFYDVTSFLPTTLVSSKERLTDVTRTVNQVYQEVSGARIQGIYFEGPFFAEEHKSAQNLSYSGDSDLDTFHERQKASGGIIKKIALASERNGVKEFVETVIDEGVVVALGYSNATLEEADVTVEAGASVFAHAYNGMHGLDHREPEMVGALSTLQHVFSELTYDGHHVHSQAAEVLTEKAGHDHVTLITDCMMADGIPDGNHNLGELPVVVAEGTARLGTEGLAGSISKLKEAARDVVDWGITTPAQAVMMASLAPVINCRIDDQCGVTADGRDVDFIILGPIMGLAAIYLDGVERYRA